MWKIIIFAFTCVKYHVLLQNNIQMMTSMLYHLKEGPNTNVEYVE